MIKKLMKKRINPRRIGLTLLLFIFINITLFPIVLGNNQYNVAINLNSEIYYKYTNVNDELVEKLREEDFQKYFAFTGGLYGVDIGDNLKFVITKLDEKTNFWNYYLNKYTGAGLTIKRGDLNGYIYKNTSLFLSEFLNSENPYDRPNWDKEPIMIPANSNDYLSELNQTIPIIYQQIININNTQLRIDFSGGNFSDRIVYKYNEEGIYESCSVYYDNELAIRTELVTFKLGINYSIPVFIIIIGLSIGLLGIEIFLILKNKIRINKRSKDKFSKF